MDRTKEDSKCNEHQASPYGMRQLFSEALPFAQPTSDGIRKSNANQKRERRLDQVVKTQPRPLHMCLFVSKDVPEQAVGISPLDGGKIQNLAHHKQHHQASISVNGDVARSCW